MVKNIISSLLIGTLLFSCTKKEQQKVKTTVQATNHVLLSSEVEWEKLNPARGDQSPQAGTLWGG